MAVDLLDDVRRATPARRRRPLALAGVVVAVLGLMATVGATIFVPSAKPILSRLDHWTADWRTAYFSRAMPGAHPRIAIVGINDATLRDYVSSPVDRRLLAKLVSAIDAAGAQAIGIDVFFLKKTDPAHDTALLEAIRAAKAEVVMGAVDERFGLERFQSDFQRSWLAETGRKAGYLNLRHERDEVVRYTASPNPGGAFGLSFAHLLAAAGGVRDGNDVAQPVSWLRTPDNGAPAFVKVLGQHLLDPATGASVSKQLTGRVVLIGGDFPLRDRHRTPLGVKSGALMSGVEIHAHIIAQLFEPQRAVRELSALAIGGVLVAVGLVGFFAGYLPGLGGIAGYLGYGFATVLLVLVDVVVYSQLHILLPFTMALLAWVLALSAGRLLRIVLS